MQKSLLEVVTTLRQIGETLADNYTAEQFARDVEKYTEHMEQCLHYLKIVGVVPKDQVKDPELNGIFVPLRIELQDQTSTEDKQLDTITTVLEHYPYLVLLGGPGSGKSTAVRYLAWSHAAANQSPSSASHLPLLPGNPLPLRIELRRLIEERRHQNYDFLSYASEVLLKREDIDIQPRMFKELLKRRAMLLLFDGLDEVATLHERQGLVEEIEHFASAYPGNRVIVTSRPVGYELAPISHPSFSRAQIQNFNDEQILLFVENWYMYVLRLSPIPYEEQRFATQWLLALAQRPDLSLEQALQAARSLYRSSPSGSEEQRFATQWLLSLIPHLDTIKHEERDDMYRILRRMVPQFDKINPQSTP